LLLWRTIFPKKFTGDTGDIFPLPGMIDKGSHLDSIKSIFQTSKRRRAKGHQILNGGAKTWKRILVPCLCMHPWFLAALRSCVAGGYVYPTFS
jgi:hypothetical protein